MGADLLDELRQIPSAPRDDLSAERVRRRAQTELAKQRSLAGTASGAAISALLTAACVVYGFWALTFSAALYR